MYQMKKLCKVSQGNALIKHCRIEYAATIELSFLVSHIRTATAKPNTASDLVLHCTRTEWTFKIMMKL